MACSLRGSFAGWMHSRNRLMRNRLDLAPESAGTITVVRFHEPQPRCNRSGFSGVGQAPTRSVPTHDSVKPLFVLLLPTGDVLEFQDFTQTTKPLALFSWQTAPGDRSKDVMAYSMQRITEIQPSGTAEGEAAASRRDSSRPPASDSSRRLRNWGLPLTGKRSSAIISVAEAVEVLAGSNPYTFSAAESWTGSSAGRAQD